MVTIREFADKYNVKCKAVSHWFGVLRKNIDSVHWKYEGKPPCYYFDDYFSDLIKEKMSIVEETKVFKTEKNTRKRRTVDEMIADLEEQAKQIAERKKQLLARKTHEEQKKHTKLLFDVGKAICKVLREDTVEGDELSDNDVANFITFLEENKDEFLKALGRKRK